MFQFFLGVLILASNFLVVSRAIEMRHFRRGIQGLILAAVFVWSSSWPVSFAEAATPPPGTPPMYCLNVGTALYLPADLDQLRTNPTGKFCLGRDIDMKGINWVPIGVTSGVGSFGGELDGVSCSDLSRPKTCKAHIINNLKIRVSSPSSAAPYSYGLFGDFYSVRIANIGLLNVNITVTQMGSASVYVGGLGGFARPGTSITHSYVTGRISLPTGGTAGGLVGGGFMSLIQNSFSKADVSAVNGVLGGLVGWSICQGKCQIIQSYATGTVASSGGWLGGLVGNNNSNIERSYATGPVIDTSIATQYSKVGGLVGLHGNNLISQSYATGLVRGGSSSSVGGLVGWAPGSGSSITQSYAIGDAAGGNSSDVGGLVGLLGGACVTSPCSSTVNQSYATGHLAAGSGGTGGLVARRDTGGSVTSSYWDVESTGQSTSPGGGTPIQTILELKTKLPGGFDPAVWGVYPRGVVIPYSPVGAIYPYLHWQSSVVALDGSALNFPLHKPASSDGVTPFTIPIITVVDHSGTPLDPDPTKRHPWYFQDGQVTAYNGETGSKLYGENCPPVGYKKDALGTPFILNGHYVGSGGGPNCKQTPKAYLNYDGHPGFDYSVVAGTQIYAPANGVLRKAQFDNVNHNCGCTHTDGTPIEGWNEWHSFYIDHGSGYSTWYLHVADPPGVTEGPVKKGDAIAKSGSFGQCHPVGPHLHFEVRNGPVDLVRKDCTSTNPPEDHVVDPYADAVWKSP